MTVQADFVATLVDEWARAGVTQAVIAPGSRSAPLALALLAHPGIEVTVRLDERSAAFACLGIGLASGVPAVLCTTSGTAAAEAHAAVIEADLAGVPMIVCTADRPVELQRVGAPQTIDQRDLYGRAVRAFVDLGSAVSDDFAVRAAWRSLASRVVLDATCGPTGPGPVHVNLPLRDPLLAPSGELPAGRAGGAPWHAAVGGPGASAGAVDDLAGPLASTGRALLVVGAATLGAPAATRYGSAVSRLAARLRCPVLADPRAFPWVPAPSLVFHADAVLRSARARTALRADVVVHLGAPHASKVLSGWWSEPAGATTRHLVVEPWGRFTDPERRADLVVRADPVELCAVAAARLMPPDRHRSNATDDYLSAWRAAEKAAGTAIASLLDDEAPCSEPGLARRLFAELPAGSALVVASSMPVRDIEWFAQARPRAPLVLANRGANGIDGVVSTAIGVALARRRSGHGATVALVGDLAFLHDLTALVHGRREQVPDLTLVVVDNGGGGIFSFLPYASELDEERFERAFGTPQAADPAEVAAALGHHVATVAKQDELRPALSEAIGLSGISVVVVRTDRGANAALHARLAEASAAAVDAALAS